MEFSLSGYELRRIIIVIEENKTLSIDNELTQQAKNELRNICDKYFVIIRTTTPAMIIGRRSMNAFQRLTSVSHRGCIAAGNLIADKIAVAEIL